MLFLCGGNTVITFQVCVLLWLRFDRPLHSSHSRGLVVQLWHVMVCVLKFWAARW
jgi:hypothetical protein